jgi:hypothetical protein
MMLLKKTFFKNKRKDFVGERAIYIPLTPFKGGFTS